MAGGGHSSSVRFETCSPAIEPDLSIEFHAYFKRFAIQSMVGSSGRQRVVDSILADFDMKIPSNETLNEFDNSASSMALFIPIEAWTGQVHFLL